MKEYHDKIFDEISRIIKDNLELLYNYNDDALLNIKEYCNINSNKKYQPLTYDQLVYFTEEAIAEIINTPNLYDFRSLE